MKQRPGWLRASWKKPAVSGGSLVQRGTQQPAPERALALRREARSQCRRSWGWGLRSEGEGEGFLELRREEGAEAGECSVSLSAVPGICPWHTAQASPVRRWSEVWAFSCRRLLWVGPGVARGCTGAVRGEVLWRSSSSRRRASLSAEL